MLPVRWLAPEALLEDEYSMKSSVFSWAWLAWEILTQATLPHSTITDQQVRLSTEKENREVTERIFLSFSSLFYKRRKNEYIYISEL